MWHPDYYEYTPLLLLQATICRPLHYVRGTHAPGRSPYEYGVETRDAVIRHTR